MAGPASADPSRTSCWCTAPGSTPRAGSRSTTSSPRRASTSRWCRSPRPRSPTTSPRRSAILDLQDGPTLLVGHSYGGSIITEAGVHPKVVGLVYVAAHAPDVGEDESALGKKTPSVLGKTEGAIKVTPDGFTYLEPAEFPKLFAPDLPRERGGVRGALAGARRGERVQHAADGRRLEDQAELGHRRRQRPDHQSGSRALVLRARQERHASRSRAPATRSTNPIPEKSRP